MTSDIGLATIKSLSIVVTLMFFGGTMQVMSYYQEFGFRFSDLSLQYHHILFRGISLAFTNVLAFVVIFFCFLMIILDYSGYSMRLGRRKIGLGKAQGLAMAMCFPLIFVIGSLDGFHTAQRDVAPCETTLRELIHLTKGGDDKLPIFDHLNRPVFGKAVRVFIVHRTSRQLSVIAPYADTQRGAAKPKVFHIPIGSGVTYVDKEREKCKNHDDSRSFWLSLF